MRSLRAICLAASLAAIISGCAPVREDRKIQFSADGRNVAFQHGAEGVFVADAKGRGLRKIFTPAKDTLAVGSPLFSPADGRLIFTTARAADSNAHAPKSPFDPAGAVHDRRAVVYTCWLRGDKEGDEPEELFSARCDHVGYVAANLAVRWHPRGDRVLFLDDVGDGKHGVFTFDLATQAKSPISTHRSAAVIFDWAPDNEHLVCVRAGEGAGIWIGKPGAEGWWHVSGSDALAAAELPSAIERLRATAPAWSKDGRFAFVTHSPAEEQGGAGKHLLHAADLATRKVATLESSDRPFREPRWCADGRLGVVHASSLRVVMGGKVGPAFPSRPVRHFAGWSADGKHLALVAHDFDAREADGWMALLFAPDPLARDVVVVAPGGADTPGREALSGVRVTFPHWSPTENKLSFWGTFTPSHRSWLGAAMGSALRPGDPAAVIDLSTGKLTWMPVSPAEMAQVGHYHMLKRDHAEAWRWYERARAGEAKAGARPPAAEDFSFFEYHCLTKLGRHEEAKAKLEQWRGSFAPSFGDAVRVAPVLQVFQLGGRSAEDMFKELAGPDALSGQMLRDLYQGEVFLSLGAAEDGAAHFRAGAEAAKTHEGRLSRTVLLAQMLLARKKWHEYARVMKSLLPLVLKWYDPNKLDAFPASTDGATLQQAALIATAGVTLLPLTDREVLDACAADDLEACLPLLEALADKSTSSLTRSGSHVILYAVARKLGRDVERRKALDVLRKLDATLTEENLDERARAGRAALRAGTLALLNLVGAP